MRNYGLIPQSKEDHYLVSPQATAAIMILLMPWRLDQVLTKLEVSIPVRFWDPLS